MVRSIRSRPLLAFFVLAFAITWAVWVPRAAGVPVGTVGQLWTWLPAGAGRTTSRVGAIPSHECATPSCTREDKTTAARVGGQLVLTCAPKRRTMQ
jgi:hypothetical protein